MILPALLACLLQVPAPPTSPAAGHCGVCHIMDAQVASWARSRHAAFRCEECHLPGGWRRLPALMNDGLRHASLQAFRKASEGPRIREAGATTVQANCLRCHGPAGGPAPVPRSPATPRDSAHLEPGRACAGCHRESPHGPPAPRHGNG